MASLGMTAIKQIMTSVSTTPGRSLTWTEEAKVDDKTKQRLLASLPKVIGICGRKQHGKDTIAAHLIEKYGYVKLSFADALKAACQILFGFNNDQLHGDKKETVDAFWGVTPRSVLQFVGTELFRKQLGKLMPGLHEAFWVKCLQRRLETELSAGKRIVLTDVRFPDELKVATYVMHVDRRTAAEKEREEAEDEESEVPIHESEMYADTFAKAADVCFKNLGTVKELHEAVDAHMRSL